MSHETPPLSGPSDSTRSTYSILSSKASAAGTRVRDALVFSSAYLACIAVVQVVIAMAVLSLSWNFAPVVVGLVTFAVYAGDRVADAETDAVSNPRQAAFARRHGDVLYVLVALAYGLAVALSVFGGPVALAVTVLPGAFWVVYAADVLPDIGARVQRLKDVFLLNTAVVALAWATTLTFLPLAFAGASVTPSALVVFAYFFLGTFVSTEIPNVRDTEGDREIGVSTLPVVVGVTRTRQALYGVTLAAGGLVVAAIVVDLLPAVAATLLIGLGYLLAVTALVGRREVTNAVTIAAECQYLVAGAVLTIVALG